MPTRMHSAGQDNFDRSCRDQASSWPCTVHRTARARAASVAAPWAAAHPLRRRCGDSRIIARAQQRRRLEGPFSQVREGPIRVAEPILDDRGPQHTSVWAPLQKRAIDLVMSTMIGVPVDGQPPPPPIPELRLVG